MGSKPIGISGSRAAAVLGMSPWATPFSVWQDIMEARQPKFNAARKYDYEPFEGNAATRWGLAFEDAIIKLAEGKAGSPIVDREGEYHSQEEGCYDLITCHIDGIYKFPLTEPATLHEGKTTTLYGFGDKWGSPGTDRIPIEYQIQAQHCMMCAGADECIVSVLVFPRRPDEWEAEGTTIIQDEEGESIILSNSNGPEHPFFWAELLHSMGFFHQYRVQADPALHKLMIEKYRVWWTKYVIGETPPEPANYADIRAMITAPSGTIVVDADTARWFREYKDIGSEISATGNLAMRRDQLKTMILDRARSLEQTLDDESVDKWIFRDDQGQKLGSYGRNKNGVMGFR